MRDVTIALRAFSRDRVRLNRIISGLPHRPTIGCHARDWLKAAVKTVSPRELAFRLWVDQEHAEDLIHALSVNWELGVSFIAFVFIGPGRRCVLSMVKHTVPSCIFAGSTLYISNCLSPQ